MRMTIILFLTFFANVCFGQDTIFFDAKWKSTSRINAEFFRVEKKEGEKWTRSDFFFKTMQLQMKGTYSSLAPEIQDGYFEWYHSNGKLKHKGIYEKGKNVGEHLWYGDNGNIEAKENYKNGLLNGVLEEYYPNGKLRQKSELPDGIQNGWTVYYREDGSKHSEGNFNNGNRNGEWKYFDKRGEVEGTENFKIDYEIKEAKMFLQLPNDEWFLTDHSDKGLIHYIFKRNEIVDSLGRSIIPAIMLYIDDVKDYNNDLITYSLNKRIIFKDVKVQKTFVPSDKYFPLSYKNAIVMITSYTDKGINHILYIAYIINDDNIGIQIYMDMTKDIADKYEKEFWTTLQSIKEMT